MNLSAIPKGWRRTIATLRLIFSGLKTLALIAIAVGIVTGWVWAVQAGGWPMYAAVTIAILFMALIIGIVKLND